LAVCHSFVLFLPSLLVNKRGTRGTTGRDGSAFFLLAAAAGINQKKTGIPNGVNDPNRITRDDSEIWEMGDVARWASINTSVASRGEPEQQWAYRGLRPLSKSTLPFSLALIGIIHGDAHFVHVLGGGGGVTAADTQLLCTASSAFRPVPFSFLPAYYSGMK